MEDVLKKIVAHKRLEVEREKKRITMCEVVPRRAISMRGSLEQSTSGIIAEFKRRSPSKGWINESADVSEIVSGYRLAGAAACSVLTDSQFFGGSLDDLIAARAAVGESLPLLRKEFIIDTYQIFQAQTAMADAVLLIAACLSISQCAELAVAAHEIGLEVLLEIHSEDELSYLNPNIDMLGVNNRNLGTFHTDINNSFGLANALKSVENAPLLISESGIKDAEEIRRLRDVGFRGFLIGETFMKCADPSVELSNLIKEIEC